MITAIDHSALQVARTCWRKYYWTYERRLDAGRSLPMDEGRAIHEGLYTWYQTGDVEAAKKSVVLERPEGLLSQELEMLSQREQAMRDLLEGYTKQFPKEDFRIVGVEMPLAWYIGGDYYYVGIVDGLISFEPIGLLVHEYKRTSQIATDWVARFQLDHQTTGYVLLGRKNGHDVKGAVLSVLRATKYPEYVRDTVITPDWLIEEMEQELRALIGELDHRRQRALEDGYEMWFPKNTNACFQYNQACPYRKLCLEGPRTREQMLQDGFFKQRAERELGILERALKRGGETTEADNIKRDNTT